MLIEIKDHINNKKCLNLIKRQRKIVKHFIKMKCILNSLNNDFINPIQQIFFILRKR